MMDHILTLGVLTLAALVVARRAWRALQSLRAPANAGAACSCNTQRFDP
jgi:hypothetical protein